MIQFYSPDIETMLRLPQSDSQHCVRVLRMNVGDALQVVDGRGNVFSCRLLDNNAKGASVEIVGKESRPPHWGCRITIAVAPTKHLDKMEWLVEKLVENGVDRIVPLLTARSERRVLKRERIEKIAVSAMKQSLKATLPEIDELTPIAAFAKECKAMQAQKFIAYCADEFEKILLARAYQPGSDVVVMIGPEGDFTAAEVQACVDAGFVPVTLGESRLRTETAALVADVTVHVLNQAAG